jgi:hypothetical protein
MRQSHGDVQAIELRSSLSRTAQDLKSRRCDLIAARGVALIETMLAIEEDVVISVMRNANPSADPRATQLQVVAELLDGNEMVTKFLLLRPRGIETQVFGDGYAQVADELDRYLNDNQGGCWDADTVYDGLFPI